MSMMERYKKMNVKSFFRKAIKPILVVVALLSVSASTMTLNSKDSEALLGCVNCYYGCIPIDTIVTSTVMDVLEDNLWEDLFEEMFDRHINEEQNWIIDDFFDDFWVKGLAELTRYLTTTSMYQVEIVGMFFDAKHQLETQRLFFELQAEAHRDYHPSDDFCWFGTNARSLAASESKARENMLALSTRSMQRQLGVLGTVSESAAEDDKNARWNQFITTYCDPKDNNWTSAGNGLDLACDHDGTGPLTTTGATDRSRVNRDVDYTAMIEEPRTLDIDFVENTGTPVLTDDEEDVMALAANLYGNNVPSRRFTLSEIDDEKSRNSFQTNYLDMRSVIARRNVAEHSFNSIVAMKSSGTNGAPAPAAQPNVGSYMGAIMKELMPVGTPDTEIMQLIGDNPSYYAQLEVLGKKIYQNPDFFANLYDKPANVERKSVAMKAVNLMLDRALFESELRQEMILSILLTNGLQEKFREVNLELQKK